MAYVFEIRNLISSQSEKLELHVTVQVLNHSHLVAQQTEVFEVDKGEQVFNPHNSVE